MYLISVFDEKSHWRIFIGGSGTLLRSLKDVTHPDRMNKLEEHHHQKRLVTLSGFD